MSTYKRIHVHILKTYDPISDLTTSFPILNKYTCDKYIKA